MRKLPLRPLFVFLALSFCAPAVAGDAGADPSDPVFSLSGDIGAMNLGSDEIVYGRSGRRISQLVWKSRNVQIFTGTLKIELPQQWRLTATAQAGMNGNSHMTDYDWIAPWARGEGDNQWSDRSRHPDTRLDHFYSASVELGRNVVSFNDTTAGLGIGFRYTDVQWSAWGGSFVYSEGGYRNYRGHFNAQERGISFRQAIPVAYVGLNLAHQAGPWSFSGALQGGAALRAFDVDNHWVRGLRFTDHYDNAPVVAFKASVDYAVRPATSIYLAGSFERMFTVKADTELLFTQFGQTVRFKNAAGGNFQSMAISIGVKGRF